LHAEKKAPNSGTTTAGAKFSSRFFQ